MSDALVVSVPMCPPAGVSANSRLHWREKARIVRAYRDAAFWETCQHLGIRATRTGGSWSQGPYTAPDWLMPAYQAMEVRESNRLPVGFRRRGSWRPLPELLTLDVRIVWAKGRQRNDSTNLPHAAKHAIDGMCLAIALDDKLIRLGAITQTKADRSDHDAWTHGATVLTLRPLVAA